MPANLNDVASANSAARRRAAASLMSNDTTGRRARFKAFVEDSVFSTNVFAEKVLLFDTADEVLDARSLRAMRTVAVTVTTTVGEVDTWWPRREAFEDHWDHGRRFVYGAVNAGGVGVHGDFGPLCLVVQDPRQGAPDALAVFPADTAQRYTSSSGVVNVARAESEATLWEDRAALAVCERSSEIEADVGTWAKVVCRPDRYLEATRAGHLPLAGVDEVRMVSEYQSDLADLRARQLLGEPLSPTEAHQAAAYEAVHRWRRVRGTRIVAIP